VPDGDVPDGDLPDRGVPSGGVLVTVAVCTRNRACSLAHTLGSLAAMAPPGAPWDVLVIDNASTDGTRGVVEGFAGRLPLRLEAEPLPGLSHARNRAVAGARGRYIAWTDDDVVVGRDWLAGYARAFARWPQAALFGGPVTPVLLPPVTAWVQDNMALLAHPLGARAFGPVPLPLSSAADRLPFGANFAVRTADQRRFPYDPALGAGPLRRLAEETAVFEAMLAAGGTGWWVPDSAVAHMIPPERQTVAALRRYYAAAGATDAHRHGAAGPRLFGVPRWLWRRAAAAGLRYRLARLAAPPAVWLPHLIVLAQAEGAIRYWRGARR
jgi:Glycosyl transferase family 2